MFRDKAIWPSQCDRILASLQEIDLTIQAFSQFLDKHEHLSFSICTSRFSVMNALEHCHMLLDELIALITAFRESCWVTCYQNIVKLVNIQQKFDELFRVWTCMHRRVTIFLDRMSLLLDEEHTPTNYSQDKQDKIVLLQHRGKLHRIDHTACSLIAGQFPENFLQNAELPVES
jgi:hypothetical protein